MTRLKLMQNSPVDGMLLVWRKVLRLTAMLLLIGSPLGAAVADEIMLMAFLKAAPNVPPVEDVQATANEAPGSELHPARAALERNRIYDESNPDFSRLQRIDDATRHMQRDVVGFPDWMMALRSGAIAPRAGLSPMDKMNVLDLDVVMKNTKEMPYVRFPHQSHTVWLDCSNCHPVPFVPKAGANLVAMSDIFRGQYCGMCHDRVAFITFFSCDRCHSVPQGTRTDPR